MAPENRNPQPMGRLTLYKDLLGDNTPGTISSAPVKYDQEAKEEKKKPAFLFQPTKRPQVAAKTKNKPSAPRPNWLATSSSSPDSAAKATAQANPTNKPIVTTTLADWTIDDDDVNGFYAGERRQRGGRKKRKKNKEAENVETNWDEIYDPSNPSVYKKYKDSDDRMRMNEAWKNRLHAHLLRQQSKSGSSEGEDINQKLNPGYAPPETLQHQHESSPPPPPPDELPDAPADNDAYAGRLQLSQTVPPPPPPPPPPASTVEETQVPPPESKLAPRAYSSTISAEPVRYKVPTPTQDEDVQMVDSPDAVATKEPATDKHAEKAQNKAPGKKGFAERMMAKMGYVKGKGLGAQEDGIINALSVRPEKRKKLSDAQGGGYATPAGMGRITGGTKAKGTANPQDNKYGPTSNVVVAWGLLVGIDLEADKQRDDGGLKQKIGDEFAKSFGMVEQIIFHEKAGGDSIPVFIKFTSELSALRAVNALGEPGYRFQGNPVQARFYDSEKFKNDNYNCSPPPATGAV